MALGCARIVLGQLDPRATAGGRRRSLLLLLLSLRLSLLRLLYAGSVTGAGRLLLQRCLLVMSMRVVVGEETGIVGVLVTRQPGRGGGSRRIVITRRRGWLRIDLQ